MDENYEQVEVDKQIFGDQSRWLIDGLDVTVDILQNGELVTGEVLQNLCSGSKHILLLSDVPLLLHTGIFIMTSIQIA